MTDRLTDRLAYREELTRQAQFLCRIIDSDSVEPILRADAQARFDDISEWLLYADGPARECNIVYAMLGYRRMVEEILTDEFTPEFVADQQLRVMWLRLTAKLADTPAYSDDMRLDCADTLMMLINKMRRCAAEFMEVGV